MLDNFPLMHLPPPTSLLPWALALLLLQLALLLYTPENKQQEKYLLLQLLSIHGTKRFAMIIDFTSYTPGKPYRKIDSIVLEDEDLTVYERIVQLSYANVYRCALGPLW